MKTKDGHLIGAIGISGATADQVISSIFLFLLYNSKILLFYRNGAVLQYKSIENIL